MLVNLPLYQTEAVHILAVLDHKKAGVSTNVWLRILHNRALDLGWLLAPALNKKLWPKVKYKARRAIKASEHGQILLSERMDDYRKFFRLLWEIYKFDRRVLWIQTHVDGIGPQIAETMFQQGCQKAAFPIGRFKINIEHFK
jgi:hypothetical protein